MILLFLFHFNQSVLQAQDRESFYVEVSVPHIQELAIENTKPFPRIDGNDMSKGYVEQRNAVTLSVSSNVPWRVVIYTRRVNLYVTPGRFKPVGHFQFRAGNFRFRSISSNPVTVMEGKGGVKNFKIVIDYRLKIGWSDPPGRFDFQPQFRIEPNYEGINR